MEEGRQASADDYKARTKRPELFNFFSGAVQAGQADSRTAGCADRASADGGVNLSNIQQLIASGAKTFVVGNGLFTGKLRENIKAYQAVLTEGRAGDEAVFYRD